MKYCEYCGAELEDEMRFCSQCGRKAAEAAKEPEEAPRDYWAERLNSGNGDAPEEEPKPSRKQRKAIKTEIRIPVEPEPLTEDFWQDEQEPRQVRKHSRIPAWVWVTVPLLCGFIILAVVGMYLLLGNSRASQVTEMYYGRSCTMGREEYSGDGDWVALQQDGSAEFCLLGTEGKGSWSQSGTNIVIVYGEDFITGTLEQQILTLHHRDMKFVLSQEGMEPLETPERPAKEIRQYQWAGDYYGWWQITDAWGGWEKRAGDSWDVCARMTLDQEGMGHMEMWDTQCRRDELFCAGEFQIAEGKTQAGCFVLQEGLLCGYPMPYGAWSMDPGLEPCRSMENLLYFYGSVDGEEGGFAYEIYLRPWGLDWKAVKEMPLPLSPDGRRLPRHYKDWYLPLIDSGCSMPEGFWPEEQMDWG